MSQKHEKTGPGWVSDNDNDWSGISLIINTHCQVPILSGVKANKQTW